MPRFRLRQVSLYWVILGSECLTMMNVNITFWDVTPYYLVDNCQRCGLPARSIFLVVTVHCHHMTREVLDWFWWNTLCWRSLLPNKICNRYLNIQAGYYFSDRLVELFINYHRITEHEKDYCNSGIRTENKSSTVRYGLMTILDPVRHCYIKIIILFSVLLIKLIHSMTYYFINWIGIFMPLALRYL
jgi:hypothetical protein